jgi:calcium/proton exchanger cax
MYACSVILPIAYIVGLIFTLKTHADIFEAPEVGESSHEAPEWGKATGITILVAATILFSFISEQLVDSIVPSIAALGLNEAFVGVFFLGENKSFFIFADLKELLRMLQRLLMLLALHYVIMWPWQLK